MKNMAVTPSSLERN